MFSQNKRSYQFCQSNVQTSITALQDERQAKKSSTVLEVLSASHKQTEKGANKRDAEIAK